ncbi:TauD/TfdA family dioxygenase [Reinekea marina]|uniref:TauD/TfdA family dioxygenase n=1 Tax=Reinekea marina TaxID=1310421 RepID=A0ABV7WS05_9GAMM|nr:TauD/TfdA family dioxygenase [Reinekea marina]MDN3647599.1 TauD/TfdA family dioxygenase [Reinekea marina]
MSLNIGKIEEQKQVNGLDFPLVVLPPNETVASEKPAFDTWVTENKEALHAQLIKHGALLFRGFPVSSADAFEQFLDQTDYQNMPYVGGAAPRTQVTSSRIVTANESPATEKIPFHHEMAQTPHPPGYIFFYCDTAPASGGATSILHSGEICERFFEISPEFAQEVERQGVRYIRFMPAETDASSAIGRSWKETFNVSDRASCEEKLKEHGMSWSWLDNDLLRTESKTLPAIRFDEETQQKTFFNSILAVYTGWDDARNVANKAVVLADGQEMDATVMAQTVEAMDELCVNFKWHEGDVLFLNNHTVLHARQPFTGDRRILASIAFK